LTDKKGDAEAVVRLLAQHALAVIQASAYIKQRRCTFKEYHMMFLRQREYLLRFRNRQASSTYGGVYATFEVSTQFPEKSKSVDQSYANALELLGVLAHLYFIGVPEALFTRAWEYGKKIPEASPQGDDIESFSRWHVSELPHTLQGSSPNNGLDDIVGSLRQALGVLHSFAIITIHLVTRDISMHPLAHAWARDRLHESGKQGAWACTASLIALSTEGDREYQDFWRPLQPHVESCIDASPEELFKLYPAIEIGRMFYQFAWLFLRGEDYLRVKALTGTLWKEFDPEISGVMSGPLIRLLYAKCLSRLAEVGPAQVIFEDIVNSDKGTTGVTDETRLLAKTELASIYRSEGKYQVSVDMLQEVVQMRTSSDPGTIAALRTYNRLALALVAGGQNKEAISLLREVRIEKITLDPTHPDRYDSQRVFAMALLGDGENKEAISLLREVAQIKKLTLNSTHPHRLNSQHELARALLEEDENKEAISLLREVVHIRKLTLNPTHPELLASQHHLAAALLADGENKEAISLLREVIQIEELTLNPRHPYLLASKQCLASGLRKIGEIGEALEIIQTVLTVPEGLWEPSDPRRKDYEWLLSACLADKEKLAATSMTIPIRENDKGGSGGEGRRRGKRRWAEGR